MKKITFSIKTILLSVFAAGIVSVNASPLNNSLNFAIASSNYLSVTSPANIPIGNSPYTIQSWFYANSMGVYGIAGWGNYGTNGQVNALRLDPSGGGQIINYWWGNDLIVTTGDISGAWHNVAVTWDGTTRTMYLDGNIIGSDNPGSDNIPAASNFAVGLTWPGGSEYFDGSLDEVSIWSVALSQAKIRDNMAHGVCAPATGLALYYNMDQGIAGGNNTGITSVTDLSGNGNFGILNNFSLTGSTSNFETGAPIVNICPTGIGNTALQFDGVNNKDYVVAGNILTPSYTKEAWIYMVSDNGSFNNFVSGGDADGQHALGAPGLTLEAGHNGNWNAVQDPNPLSLGVWYHVAVTYDATSQVMTLYKNGVMVSQASGLAAYTNGNMVRIGAYNDSTNNGNCIIDEVKIWNYALSPEAVASTMDNAVCLPSSGLVAYYTFNNGTAYGDNEGTTVIPDSSGNGNNATAYNFTMWSDTSNFVQGAPINEACAQANVLSFDGVSSYASSPVFSTLTNNITFEARVYWNGPAYSNNEMIVTNGNTGTNGYAVFIDASNSYQLSVVLGSVTVMQSSAALTPGMWQTVSVVCSNGTWMLYLDGAPYILTSNTAAPNPVAGAFAIGSDQAGTENFYGSIDEVRFWSRALCETEINYRDTLEVSASTPGLLAVYHFNQGNNGGDNTAITILADSSGNGYDLTLNNFALTGFATNFMADPAALSGYGAATIVVMPNVTASGVTTFCQGDSVILTADSGTSYLWATGQTTQSVIVYGSVNDSVTVTSPDGCLGIGTSAGVTVTENLPPSVAVTGNAIGNFTICAGMTDSLMANASGNGPFSYNWSNASINDTALVMPLTNSTYSVVVTDNNGCMDTVSGINVTVNPLPAITVSGTTNITMGTNDTLTASGAVSYVWTTGSTSDTTIVAPLGNMTYTVTGTDANGCIDTASFTVTVSPLSVPNIINGASASLYPNPATQSISLSFKLNGSNVPAVINVFDEAGREVMTMNTSISNGESMPLDINTLANGTYFVKIATDKTTEVVRFIKQ